MKKKQCIACKSSLVTLLKKFNNFPATGFYYKKPKFLKRNLKLLICKSCNHIFHLNYQKNKFYSKRYFNRPAKNFLAPQALKFFSNFLVKNFNQDTKNKILEIGGGDITLFNLIKKNPVKPENS